MILATMTGKNGRKLLVLGLSRDNMKLLLAGQPAPVAGRKLGLPIDLLIVGGETEVELQQSLTGGVNDERTKTYTCCEKHAAQAGVPHVPNPMGQDSCTPDASFLPDV